MKKYLKSIVFAGTTAIILSLFIAPTPACGAFDAAECRGFVNREMKLWNVPGAAIVIIKDGKVVLSEGFGYRDVKNKKAVTPKTLFGIGSCTKAFVALPLGMLVDEKKIDFDRPVRDYYPLLKLYDPYVTEHVTVRDVLSHRTGIPRYDMAIDPADPTRDKAIERLAHLKPNAGIRERYQYNNIHYTLAGAIVDRVSGTTWEEFVRTRIFKPLGMNSSNLSPKESKRSPDHALPHKLDIKGSLKKFPETQKDIFGVPLKELSFEDIGVYGPAGSINSNIEDMAKWVMLFLDGGKAAGGQLISKETLAQLYTPQMLTGETVKYEEILPSSYGMAWMITPYRGYYLVNHAGMLEGFTAHVSFIPSQKAGIVILTNISNSFEFIASVSFTAYDMMFGLSRVDWSRRFSEEIPKTLATMKKANGEAEKARKKNTRPSHGLKDYAGTYEHPSFRVITVEHKGRHLHLSVKGIDELNVPLVHYQYDTFTTSDKNPVGGTGMKITFHTNEAGDIDRLSIPIEPDADSVIFTRSP